MMDREEDIERVRVVARLLKKWVRQIDTGQEPTVALAPLAQALSGVVATGEWP
jgi:hypothetical protein